MESAMDYHTALALLEWQIELGADEALADAPVDRYAAAQDARAQAQATPEPKKGQPTPPAPKPKIDPVAVAQDMAARVRSLDDLRAAMQQFEHCELKRGARNLVFSDGRPAARVMIIGEAPGRDEDREGRPFVGRAGQLLDRMLGAIGMDRRSDNAEQAVYITNVLPWRPPQNRDPKPEEIQMLLPFLRKHVELVKPDAVVLMGNISCQAGLGKRGITRLRGHWTQAYDTPALPMFHPAYLLRQPHAKREAWADLLALKARLEAR
ncbi:uracil-DNA glycosylase [Thalassobius sp. S69A]|uniref:uracil-DNA glycosylase n=1 Tax=unclassified Thalassovita TaxID=2619711 RepID=UPI003C7EAC99